MRKHVLLQLLDQSLETNCLHFEQNGQRQSVGRRSRPGGLANDDLTVVVHRPRFFDRVIAAGNLGLGESYMDGDFEVRGGQLHEFLSILLINRLDRALRARPLAAARIALSQLLYRLRGKASNVKRHYDIGIDLFRNFLDPTLSYSCGYLKDPNDSLQQMQINKIDRICRKLRLQPGQRLLDIGCGFGGLLIHAAQCYGVSGVGVTLSRDHCRFGNQEIEQQGLADRIQIHYQDFNEVRGSYDRVVSVGMMEHVPRAEYRRYFGKIHQALNADGIALVHAIGTNAERNRHDPFIQKYIFPSSNQPRLSEIALQLEQHGFAIADVENMVRHYGHTVRHWLKNFQQNYSRLDHSHYDRRFKRMWEYYLHCGIAAAFYSNSTLYQVLFYKNTAADMPLRRV